MTSEKCNRCTEPCPMANMAHEAAKGRMYATKEFIALQKKIDNGQLVEVVRCKDCKYATKAKWNKKGYRICPASHMEITDDDFCSYGERNDT